MILSGSKVKFLFEKLFINNTNLFAQYRLTTVFPVTLLIYTDYIIY